MSGNSYENPHTITFNADGVSVEQQIVIGPENTGGPQLTLDQIVDGLNSGELTSSLDFNMNPASDDMTMTYIRNSEGEGVAVVAAQRVTVGNYSDFQSEQESEQEPDLEG